MTHKITTKRARQIREAIDFGNRAVWWGFGTLWVMEYVKAMDLNRFQRKVAVDVYHRNR